MDIKRIVLGLFAAAAVLVGCEPKEVDYGVAKIEVSTSTLSFEASSSSQTLQVTATRDWTVSGAPDWVAVDPASGGPSLDPQNVTVTVISNDGFDREVDLTFTIGLMKEYVKVSQKGQKGQFDSGNGTKERPYSASAAYDYVISLPADTESGPFYIRGIISKMVASGGVEQYFANNSYGNASFFISDDGSTTSHQFEVYQTFYLGNRKWKTGDDDVKVGDEVIIFGPVVNYKGNTPETVGKSASYIYSLNGKIEEENPPQTEITSSTVADFIAKADESTYYRLTGTVSAFKKGTNSSGKDWMQFNLTDNSGSILVYGFNDGEYDKWANTIKDGGTVVITGTYQYYEKNKQHEVMNVTVESFEAGQTPGPGDETASGSGTLADPYNAVGAIAYIKSIGDKESTDDVYVKGKISAIKYSFSTEYGTAQFDISDDGSTSSTQFKAYSILYLGNRKWVEGDTQINVGDDVILCGKVTNYNGTYETSSQKAFIYSLNGKTDGGDTPPTPPTPGDDTASGSGTLADPYNAAGVLAYTNSLSGSDESPEDVYFKGKISSIKYTFSAQYGTATFNVSADGTTNGSQFTCYAVYYLGNKPWVDGNNQIKVGDEVVICGKVYKYNGETPETVSKKAYIYSLNGKTEDDGGDIPPTGDGGTLSNPFDIAGAIAYIDGGGSGEVYVKGKVSKIVYEFDAQHGTGTFWISDDGAFNDDNKKDFEAYSVKWLENKNWVEGNGQVKVGDEVILCGKLTYYENNSVYETASKSAYVYSVNGKTENEVSGGDTPGGGEQTEDGYKVSWTGASDWSGIGEDVISFKSGNYTITVSKEEGGTKPTVNTNYNDCRAYANNKVKIVNSAADITSLTFVISNQGKKRLTDITASAGEVKIDKDNWKVIWTGSAKEVTFTVGEKATYGTDGDSKAGQFDFDYILAKPE